MKTDAAITEARQITAQDDQHEDRADQRDRVLAPDRGSLASRPVEPAGMGQSVTASAPLSVLASAQQRVDTRGQLTRAEGLVT